MRRHAEEVCGFTSRFELIQLFHTAVIYYSIVCKNIYYIKVNNDSDCKLKLSCQNNLGKHCTILHLLKI